MGIFFLRNFFFRVKYLPVSKNFLSEVFFLKKIKLGDVCKFSSDKISVSTLTEKNYISTENLLPNRGGITFAENLPKTSTTSAFFAGDILL